MNIFVQDAYTSLMRASENKIIQRGWGGGVVSGLRIWAIALYRVSW